MPLGRLHIVSVSLQTFDRRIRTRMFSDNNDDLYIIGAVCHKSDYFAQRNFLEPSGTI